jgi:hypothetical protein
MKYLRKESSIREVIVGITNIGIRRWLVWSSSSRIRPNYRTEGGDKRDIVALRAGRNARWWLLSFNFGKQPSFSLIIFDKAKVNTSSTQRK